MDLTEARILIVDDTPENIDLLGDLLADYKRSVALNGEKALKIASGPNTPDLILLDVMMPGMDGFEVCRRLKEDEKTRDIPVIFITAKNSVEDEAQGLELGAVDFIPKPISPPVVLARVKNHLRLKFYSSMLQSKNAELAERNQYITDSIRYAQKIQSAILPDPKMLEKNIKDGDLIFSPKDIVSGDFFWCAEVDGLIFVAVIDCTGHGVPGAFMSMIGNTLLNDIVKVRKVSDPGQILNLLDQGIILELNKEENQDTIDGMDIALCAIDRPAGKLHYAGAYRPLFHFHNGDLIEIKGTKKSIGDRKRQIEFATTTVDIDASSVIYLFTDGLIDQNNSAGEKFGIQSLRDHIKENATLPVTGQKEVLYNKITGFMGNEVQRDDITVAIFKPF